MRIARAVSQSTCWRVVGKCLSDLPPAIDAGVAVLDREGETTSA